MRARDVEPGQEPWWYTPRTRTYAGGAAEHKTGQLELHRQRLPKVLRAFLKRRDKARAAKARAEEKEQANAD